MRKLLQSVRRRPHRWMSYGWLALAVPTLVWWSDSVLWVALMSLYANFETSRAADAASRDNQPTPD